MTQRGAYCATCNGPRTFDAKGCLSCTGRACGDCGNVTPILVVAESKRGEMKLCRHCVRGAA